ncbi:MAG TPA: PAS domain-containing protein, partial [bacterium]
MPLVKAINGEETNDMELFVKNANHPEGVSIHVTGRPIKDENGRNRGGVIIVRDITQRKKAEEEARRSQVFIASVLENLPNMVFVKDAKDLRFIMFNKAGEELLGYSRTDLIGKNDFDFFPKKEADFFTSKDRQVLAGRTLQDIPEETVQTRNKGERILHTRKIPLMDGAGAPEYLLGISEDITEQKRQEALRVYTKVLETSNRELQDFIFVASHDLQEPLRKIQTFGDFLKEETGASLSPTASDYLGRMQDAAHRMSILIEDLLQLTRITTQAKSFEPVNLSDILKEVLSDLDIRLKESGGRVEAYGLPRLIADPSQMRQLFQNLIANSLKFRKAGVSPLIEVKGEVDQRSDKCLIRVMDNGIGFDQKYADKIFNVFQRLHGSGEYEG